MNWKEAYDAQVVELNAVKGQLLITQGQLAAVAEDHGPLSVEEETVHAVESGEIEGYSIVPNGQGGFELRSGRAEEVVD